jgi:glycosyl transferase family 1
VPSRLSRMLLAPYHLAHRTVRAAFWPLIVAAYVGVLLLLCVFARKRRRGLIWGPVPLINNVYWSAALKRAGWESQTFVTHHYAISRRGDFDLYFDDVVPRWLWPRSARDVLKPYFAMLHVCRTAAVLHMPFSGGPLGSTRLWRLEGPILRRAGVRTVVLPIGFDAYPYSQVQDPTLRNALLMSYALLAKEEERITARLRYWTRHADAVLAGIMIDGIGRWDVTQPTALCIDVDAWTPREKYSPNDGRNGSVRVLHTPNHRGFKGTEFLVDAVRVLQEQGLQVELVLLEGVLNTCVQEVMRTVDIHAEQFIATAYALSGIEGMACGLPVLANLENERYTRIFRRYAYLNECPILSTTPETLVQHLRVLVTDPALRERLGRAGRAYVEKYHSYETAQFLFGSLYDVLLHGKSVDLMRLFHPLSSEYCRRRPPVDHPLIENRLPPEYGGGPARAVPSGRTGHAESPITWAAS